MIFALWKSRYRAKIRNKVALKTSDHNQIKIKMPNPSQEPPASSKAYNQGLNDIDDLCTLKSKIKGQNFKHWCVKDQTQYPNQDQYSKPQLGTSSVLQSLKSLLKENRCSFHIQNLWKPRNMQHWCFKDHQPNPNQIKDAKCYSETYSFLQSLHQGLEDMDVLCTLKINLNCKNSDHGYIKE